jgi:hypothetical protein
MERGKAVFGLISAAYLLFAFGIVLSWHLPSLERFVPYTLQELLYPIDKTNLDPLRLVHFLALAYLVILAVPADRRFLGWPVLRPVIRCGEHPLEIFCLSIFLSFGGHILLVQLDDTIAAQCAVSVAGITLMVAAAYYLAWFRKKEKAAAKPADRPSGGEPG